MNGKRALQLLFVLAGITMLYAPAAACEMPVFQYALERWPATPYMLTVFHRGKLAAPEQAVVDKIERAAADDGVNILVTLVDAGDEMDAETAKLWKDCQDKPLPQAVLNYPPPIPSELKVWSGKLADFPSETAWNSPTRRKIVERAVAGDAGVWVLVECGDKAKDDAAATLLAAHLAKLEKELKLPVDSSDLAESQPASAPAAQVKFTLVRVSRTAPAEQLFIRMLMGPTKEADQKGPMAYVVFGRGRFLGPLVGEGLVESVISDLCELMVGECSCQIKDQSPGVQLLMAAEWDALLANRPAAKANVPSVAGLAEIPSTRPDTWTSTRPGGMAAVPPSTPPGNTLIGNVLIVAMALTAVVLAVTVLLLVRRGRGVGR